MPEMWVCYLVCACVANLARSELFTAMVDLERALYAERDIARELKENVRLEEERLALLKSIADDYEKHSSNALSNPNFYLGNPVNAFLLVKRFTLDWDKVSHLLKNSSVDDIISRIHIYRQDLPGIEDLNGAAAALLRLQDTYKLETAEIARGNIAGVRSTELSADECFELGRYAYIEKDYYHTVMWMQEALDRESQEESTVDRASVLDYLAFAMSMQGNTRHALFLTNELLNLDPTHERARNNKQYYERIINDEMSNSEKRGDDGELPIKNIRKLDPYRNSEEYFTYESLCRGEVTKKLKDAHKLKCRYVDHRSPFLKLAPAKEEEIHLQPWIVMYHDVISDREIETVKELATPRLNRATVQNSVTGKLEFANYRISKSAWLKNEHHPAIVKINSRIESITGLNMNTAEELQVANYGIGGHYEPHFDFARKRETNAFDDDVGNRIATFLFYKEEVNAFKRFGHGNRIATFLFYMSDVEAGGATVFPYLGVKVFPKKGAAAFWYNLYKNGEGIYDTRHAACPVLVGRKWVSNKWIHERGQEFRRPCSLAEFE